MYVAVHRVCTVYSQQNTDFFRWYVETKIIVEISLDFITLRARHSWNNFSSYFSLHETLKVFLKMLFRKSMRENRTFRYSDFSLRFIACAISNLKEMSVTSYKYWFTFRQRRKIFSMLFFFVSSFLWMISKNWNHEACGTEWKKGAMIWKINFVVFNFILFDSSSKVCVTVWKHLSSC